MGRAHNGGMTVEPPTGSAEEREAFWREYLENPDGMQAKGRQVFRRLPHGPRCRLCAAPFAGVGGSIMRLTGTRVSDHNPTLCNRCSKVLIEHRGGAEVAGSMLFADIRGSTSMAEGMTPTAFRQLLDRFYTAASEVVFGHDGIVDKFVGDELVAVFPPMLTRDRHAAHAVRAGLALLVATGHAEPDGPWVPVGAGIQTGRVWFGAIGEGSHVEVTVVGDAVNTAARLAAAAHAGEVLVSATTAEEAGLSGDLPRRSLDLKGKAEPVDVVVVTAQASVAVAG
jgi:adenylate cyclase